MNSFILVLIRNNLYMYLYAKQSKPICHLDHSKKMRCSYIIFVPEGIICLVISASALMWFIRYDLFISYIE